MKIAVNNVIYVQKNDLELLIKNEEYPDTLALKLYSKSSSVVDNVNRYNFVKIEEQAEIDFINGIDWILDYSLFKDLTEEELIKLHEKYIKDKKTEANKCDYKILNHKILSLRAFMLYKKGELELDFPDEIKEDFSIQTDSQTFEKKLGRIFGQKKATK